MFKLLLDFVLSFEKFVEGIIVLAIDVDVTSTIKLVKSSVVESLDILTVFTTSGKSVTVDSPSFIGVVISIFGLVIIGLVIDGRVMIGLVIMGLNLVENVLSSVGSWELLIVIDSVDTSSVLVFVSDTSSKELDVINSVFLSDVLIVVESFRCSSLFDNVVIEVFIVLLTDS